MNRFLVVTIDGTKARFFTFEPEELPGSDSGSKLIEREQLSNPSHSLHGQDLWANTKTGRNRGTNGQGHTYDDRRQNHVVEFERQFTKGIANKIVELNQTFATQRLLLVAEPQILGIMRDSLSSILPKSHRISELAKDICHFKPHEIHEYLTKKALLPARRS
ncbi:MAG: host attachment protein [Synechococcus sp.]